MSHNHPHETPMSDEGAHHHAHGGDHIVPIPIYVGIFAALIVLTWVTAGVATLDLGRLNVVVALAIAVFKASLVLFFFMHVKYGTRLVKMVVVTGVYWLILLLGIVMVDIMTRTWMGVPGR